MRTAPQYGGEYKADVTSIASPVHTGKQTSDRTASTVTARRYPFAVVQTSLRPWVSSASVKDTPHSGQTRPPPATVPTRS